MNVLVDPQNSLWNRHGYCILLSIFQLRKLRFIEIDDVPRAPKQVNE